MKQKKKRIVHFLYLNLVCELSLVCYNFSMCVCVRVYDYNLLNKIMFFITKSKTEHECSDCVFSDFCRVVVSIFSYNISKYMLHITCMWI